MRILVLDNYDSFTHNLVHLVKCLGNVEVDIYKNDEIDDKIIQTYDKIILSPGPGLPAEAGQLLPIIKKFAPEKPILGVCLGHQAIAEAFGGKLVNLDSVFHGLSTSCQVIVNENKEPASDLFKGLPGEFKIGRYHSWVVDEESLPGVLEITARDENGYIMGLKHRSYDVEGVQFHPESILTPQGETIIKNWV